MANIDGVNPPVLNDTDYVNKIEDSFNAIDDHDHSTGKGVPIAAGGIAAGAVTEANIAPVVPNAGKFLERADPTGAVISNLHTVPAGVVVGDTDIQTLTNKILSGNTAATLISGSGTLTLNTTGTVTVPNATDTLVGKATSDVLTNKTLTGNTAANLVSGSGTTVLNTTGTITVPNGTDTLVGKATSDVLTNKTLTGNTAVNLISGSGTLVLNTTGTVTVPNGTDTVVTKTSSDVLTNKTLTTPLMTDPEITSGPLMLPEQATPSTPASGKGKIYFKSDGIAYSLNHSGTESALGSTAGATFTSRNFIDNAQFRFAQKNQSGLSNMGDGTAPFNVDRWYMLGSAGANQANGIIAETAAGFQTQYAGQFRTAGGAGPQRYGTCQIIEASDAKLLRGQTVTFSFAARTDGTEVTTLRAGIVEWTGTTDAPTRDIVSSWAATPTLIANAAFVNTPADITISSSWARFSVTATLGTSLNNLVVFIWTPNTEADNDDFYLKEMQLVKGGAAPAFEVTEISYQQDLARCQRFSEKSYDTYVDNGTVDSNGSEFISAAVTATADLIKIPFKVTKFKTPTILFFSPQTGTGGKVRERDTATDINATAVGVGYSGYVPEFSAVVTRTYQWHWYAHAEIGV